MFGIDSISVTPIATAAETFTSYTLNRSQVPDFDERLGAVLDGVRVNDQVSLREYVRLELAGDEARLQLIRSSSTESPEPSRWQMVLAVGSRPVHQFWSRGLRYSGGHDEALRLWVMAHGTKHKNSPARHPSAEPSPLDDL